MKFCYKMGFSCQNNYKNHELSDKTDLDFGIVYEEINLCVITEEIWY